MGDLVSSQVLRSINICFYFEINAKAARPARKAWPGCALFAYSFYRMQPPRQHLDFVAVGMVELVFEMGNIAENPDTLSPADHQRAARFRFPEDRLRFVTGRRLLATLLREHLGHDRAPLDLAVTEQGKPFLAAHPAVAFSISHAGQIVVVAVGTNLSVGVDVETLDRQVSLDSLAPRIFNSGDLARFHRLPEDKRLRAFFRAWTGKEALLKAKGVGLFGGIRETVVPLDDAGTDLQEEDALRWRLEPLRVPANHIGSVIWNNPQRALRVRAYQLKDLD